MKRCLRGRVGLASLTMIMLIACGGPSASTPSSAAPAPQATAAITATPSAAMATAPAAAKTYANLNDLYLQSGGNVRVTRTMEFGNRFANEPRYKADFGGPHVSMTQQMVTIGANSGGVTFVEFASQADATKAVRTLAAGSEAQRRSKPLQYGRILAFVHVSKGDQAAFARDVKAALDKH